MMSSAPVCPTLPFRGLKRAKPFYEKKLGLKLVDGSVRAGYLEYRAGKGTRIQLFESDSRKSKDTAATFVVGNLAREMKALRKRGVKFQEYDLPDIKTVDGVATHGDMKAAWIQDPGGNVLGLLQPGS